MLGGQVRDAVVLVGNVLSKGNDFTMAVVMMVQVVGCKCSISPHIITALLGRLIVGRIETQDYN